MEGDKRHSWNSLIQGYWTRSQRALRAVPRRLDLILGAIRSSGRVLSSAVWFNLCFRKWPWQGLEYALEEGELGGRQTSSETGEGL